MSFYKFWSIQSMPKDRPICFGSGKVSIGICDCRDASECMTELYRLVLFSRVASGRDEAREPVHEDNEGVTSSILRR